MRKICPAISVFIFMMIPGRDGRCSHLFMRYATIVLWSSVSQKNLELLDTWNLEQEDGIVFSVINTCDQDAVFEKV